MLAGTGDAVMAIAAVTGDTAVLETGMPPVCGSVAVVALIVALNMVGALAIRPHVIVATFALIGRTEKQTVDMATVTLHISVAASQRKAGGEMVKFADRRTGDLALQPQ